MSIFILSFSLSSYLALLLVVMVCTRSYSDCQSGQLSGPIFSILMIISIVVFVSSCRQNKCILKCSASSLILTGHNSVASVSSTLSDVTSNKQSALNNLNLLAELIK